MFGRASNIITISAIVKPFNGAKSYKDSKICNMMTVNLLHERFHKSTGITFSSIYPGCIATTNLFREKRTWFRVLFPLFMKYVTGGFVSEEVGNTFSEFFFFISYLTTTIINLLFLGSRRSTRSGSGGTRVRQVWHILVLERRCSITAN